MSEGKDRCVISYAEIAYLLFYALMLFVKGMGLTDGQWPYELSLLLGGALIAVKLLLTEHSLAEWAAILLLILLGAMIYIHSADRGALINLAVIIGMKDVEVKKVFRLTAVLFPLTFIAQMMLHLPHILPEFFKVQEKLGLGYIIRWSLGYPHPNVLQVSAMVICAVILYLGNFRGKKLLLVTGIMLLFNLWVFLYSVSFTGIALCVLYLCANVYFTERKAFSAFEKGIIYAVFPICLLFAIFGPLCLPEPLWGIFNKLLNTRFHIAKTFMGMNPVTAFGVGWCNELPADLNNLDSSYVYALMHYGLLFFLLFAFGYMALIVYLMKKDRRSALSAVLCFSVAAISEQFVVNSSFKNVTWVFLGAAMFEGLSAIGARSGKEAAPKPGLSAGFSLFGLSRIGKKEIPAFISGMIDRLSALLGAFWEAFSENRRRILITGAAIGLLGALLFGILYKGPSAYYVRLHDVQNYLWERAVYLDPDHLPEGFDGKILTRNADVETPLMVIDGNAVALEKARGVISVGLWTAFWVIVVFGGIIVAGRRESGGSEIPEARL